MPTLYDDPSGPVKPGLSTVDHSQILDLAHQIKTAPHFDWLASELPGMSELGGDGRRHTTAASPSQPPAAAAAPKAVVPLVVEAKEAEDDDDGDARLPTRRRGDGVPATTTSASTSSRHRSYAFGGQGTTMIAGGGAGGFPQPAFIPISVCIPKDEPQTVPCVADGGGRADAHRLERKRERNRLAAQKCRLRKVEQINMLQERVEDLNRTKSELERTAEQLRRQVEFLRRHIRQHITAGCQLARASFPAGL